MGDVVVAIIVSVTLFVQGVVILLLLVRIKALEKHVENNKEWERVVWEWLERLNEREIELALELNYHANDNSCHVRDE